MYVGAIRGSGAKVGCSPSAEMTESYDFILAEKSAADSAAALSAAASDSAAFASSEALASAAAAAADSSLELPLDELSLEGLWVVTGGRVRV